MDLANYTKLALLLVCFCVTSSTAGTTTTAANDDLKHAPYKDPRQPLKVRTDDLVSRMTLEEKIGQMSQIERKVATPDVMRIYSVGSVLSGGGSVPRLKATSQDWVEMINQMQSASLESRLGIPFIYGIATVHGHNNVYKATLFPHNIGLGATRDPELVKRIGAATAREVRATG
uniref:Glycoside hydrolase family 3 N-terminal domain-containing protein n=1 Tax=Kalanchoe fedtschenkoi TaxID=63787 RepID=A0A7N1A5Z8_KALFE